ncbi:MAG TPA: dicarboxylate/amino acid:cation symporter [Candidatus Avacidaminococcus intestinavium]|uniref:Dicarboxylate/amino acid:cation symporter n=1 Tax=Candidatus Avacidaminococcus intestinavium TaxID=2840684 RepID=A0A9D1MNU1_9FIRM|nr:dicarboxylate/amino acid:cation symporter [Candidatus Avacidaminococcus intestinavium]
MKQHHKIFLGFILGIVFGLFCYYNFPVSEYPALKFFTQTLTLIAGIFLRMIFMVVVPLLVSALVLGVFELGRGRGLGKVARHSMLYTLALSSIAVILAIFMTNFFQPGAGVSVDLKTLSDNASVIKIQASSATVADKVWVQYILDLFTQNPVDSAARAFSGEIISLMVFSLIFGYAMSYVVTDLNHPLIQSLNAIFETSLKVIGFAMKLAPYAIFSLIFNTVYALGAGFLENVLYFTLLVIGCILFHQFVVYAIFLKVFAKINPYQFFYKCREVYLYAFSTASSNATLPIALEAADKVLNLPPKIARFVLTIGASANQNGSALFEGITVLFLAQVFGIQLTIENQIFVVLMAILAGVGTAGVPGGTLPVIAILLTSVGVPAEGIGLILGVDRFLDMCRTTLNVSGDLVVTQLVSSSLTEEELASVSETSE